MDRTAMVRICGDVQTGSPIEQCDVLTAWGAYKA
jgi:hypothetical protein